jgi:hypothetical protein
MTRPTLLHIVCGFFLLCISVLSLPAQNASYRSGTTDPAGNSRNLTLFRDEQIYSVGVPSATGAPWRAATMSFDANLTPTSTVSSLPWSSDIPFQQIDAQTGVGHIFHPDKDDIFVVQRSGSSPSTFVGRFADNSGSTGFSRVPGTVCCGGNE